jgi:excisionase family DNA binding protein
MNGRSVPNAGESQGVVGNYRGNKYMNDLNRTFEPLMDVDEAARLLGGIHPKTLMRKARMGDLPSYQISRSWFFRASELDAWLRGLVSSAQASNARVNCED